MSVSWTQSKHWKWFIPGHLWLLPFTLGYVLFCFAYYKARSWGFRNGVLISIAGTDMVGTPGAQTIGAATCFADTQQELRGDLHHHENTHVVEAMVAATAGAAISLLAMPWYYALPLGGALGGLAYSLTYGVVFLYYWLTTQKDEEPGWHDDYHRNFLEKIAYANQARYLAAEPEDRAAMWD